ncbi:MAG: tetratricopeptide repeat protein [Deltaproteobacteria bacterium]|nr:MAG: tetratricopeptide repeat protein [Deltaproteobacteria bacterium]
MVHGRPLPHRGILREVRAESAFLPHARGPHPGTGGRLCRAARHLRPGLRGAGHRGLQERLRQGPRTRDLQSAHPTDPGGPRPLEQTRVSADPRDRRRSPTRRGVHLRRPPRPQSFAMNHRSAPRIGALVLVAGVGLACASKRGPQAAAPAAELSPEARTAFEKAVAAMDRGAEGYGEAERLLRKALAAAPDLWQAHANLGVIYLRMGRLTAAAGALERAVAIHPDANALEALGEVYVRQGRAKDAVALFERALERNPDDLGLRNRLAVALRRAGRLDEAEAELRAILGRDAGNVDAYATLAAVWLQRGDLDLAELLLSRGIAMHPDEPKLLTNLGIVHLERGDDQRAFEAFAKAGEVDPTFLVGRLDAAAVYLRAGDHARAREQYEAVLTIAPGNVDAKIGLGIALRLAGDVDGARARWQEVLDADPRSAAAHFNLAILEMDVAERPAQARKHLEAYLDIVGKDGPRAKEAQDRLALLDAMKE